MIVSSINHESAEANGDTTVLESVSLNFTKIEIAYRKQNAMGFLDDFVKTGFDLKLNKKL